MAKHLLDLVLQDNGVIATRALYVLLNLGIILSWAVQLVEKDEERVREELMRQIMWWDQQIDRLETMLYDLEVRHFILMSYPRSGLRMYGKSARAVASIQTLYLLI